MKKLTMIMALLCSASLMTGCGNSSQSQSIEMTDENTYNEETTISESETETISKTTDVDDASETVPVEFEAYINAEAEIAGFAAKFYIETNLPDETVLMITLRRGDYNTDDHFTAQDKVTVLNGKAESAAFLNKGGAFTGEYDLSISMSIPKLQTDAVRNVIGQNGEYMTGPIVEDSIIDSSKVISALFTLSADDGSLTPAIEYNNTIFRDDDTNNSTESVFEATDYNGTEREKSKVEKKVKEYIDENYTYTEIDSVTINENLGTDTDGDYIALINLTWNQKNSGKTSKEMLTMYSSDMAARMYDDLPEIQELAVFWTVPYLNSGSAKISFERTNSGMQYVDTIFDSNFD